MLHLIEGGGGIPPPGGPYTFDEIAEDGSLIGGLSVTTFKENAITASGGIKVGGSKTICRVKYNITAQSRGLLCGGSSPNEKVPPRTVPYPDHAPGSGANYAPEKIAWFIEMMSASLQTPVEGIRFEYPLEIGTRLVAHPLDRFTYLTERQFETRDKSPELVRYEIAAKKSKRLREYQKEHGITYFKEIQIHF